MKKIENILPGIRKNISLKNYNTFKIGGPSKYFFVAKNKEDIIKTVQAAKKLRIPFFILGEGSNLLVSDKGFKGLVIRLQNRKYKVKSLILHAEAGISFPVLVRETTKLGLAGLEWAGGLPGTLGGAVIGNAGAFGGEIKDVISAVEILDRKGNVRKLRRPQCNFSYRSSILSKNNWIVLSAFMKLKKGNKKNIQSIAKDHIRYRKERHPLEYPNIGSIFKNCNLTKIPKKIRANFSHVVKIDPFPVVPTAYLISEAGLKRLRVGKAEVSNKHPNYIVNLGGAKAKDVIKLIHLVKEKIKNKFGVVLEEEIQFVGF